MPIAEAPKDPPKGDIAVGQSPGGKALKFIHRGSYNLMDNTYEAITTISTRSGSRRRIRSSRNTRPIR